MAASGRATWHADVSMASSGRSGMMTSAWPMLTSSMTRSTLTQSTVSGRRSQGAHWTFSGSHRQVGPACQCCAKRKRKKGSRLRVESPPGLFSFLGLLGRSRPVSSSLPFPFSSLPAAADTLVPLVGVSGIPCGLLLIRCEL